MLSVPLMEPWRTRLCECVRARDTAERARYDETRVTMKADEGVRVETALRTGFFTGCVGSAL